MGSRSESIGSGMQRPRIRGKDKRLGWSTYFHWGCPRRVYPQVGRCNCRLSTCIGFSLAPKLPIPRMRTAMGDHPALSQYINPKSVHTLSISLDGRLVPSISIRCNCNSHNSSTLLTSSCWLGPRAGSCLRTTVCINSYPTGMETTKMLLNHPS